MRTSRNKGRGSRKHRFNCKHSTSCTDKLAVYCRNSTGWFRRSVSWAPHDTFHGSDPVENFQIQLPRTQARLQDDYTQKTVEVSKRALWIKRSASGRCLLVSADCGANPIFRLVFWCGVEGEQPDFRDSILIFNSTARTLNLGAGACEERAIRSLQGERTKRASNRVFRTMHARISTPGSDDPIRALTAQLFAH